MDYHHHARLTTHGRELLCRAVVEGRLGLCAAAAAHKLSRQTASKWVKRYRAEGLAGLRDRGSRPRTSPRRVDAGLMARVEALRRERWTGVRIAQARQHAPQEKGPAPQPTRQLGQVLPGAGDTRDQVAAQVGAADIRWFIEAHRADFTTRPQAERWFDAEAKRLSQLPNPATARGVFEGSSAPDSPSMTVRQSLDEHRKGIEAGTQRVKWLDRQMAEHRDPRSVWQVLMGKPDERLISLQIDRAAALAQVQLTQERIQRIEAVWTKDEPVYRAMAEATNAPRLADLSRQAQRLHALRPDVLRECGRCDQDAQEQHKRREAEMVDYIRAELVKDTPPSEIREQIFHKLPFSPDNARYVDQLIRKVHVEEQKKLEDFKRELGIKPVMRKPPGRGGMQR